MPFGTKMYMYRATEKHMCVRAVKSKSKALRHFKVDPVLKIDQTVYKQAKFMCCIILLYYSQESYNMDTMSQGSNARKVNCGCVYSAYILKPVLSGRNL